MAVRQIVYISECTIPDIFRRAEIETILSRSQQNNAADDITGLLLLVENRFIQLLEGPSEAVGNCMSRIRSDSRNTGFRLILDRKSAGRLFSGWNMYFLNPSPADIKNRTGLTELTDLSLFTRNPDLAGNLAIRLMESYARLSLPARNPAET